ncbi:hypothetical protein [Antarcticirhabdus aurantiaca]|uniref:Uncharacterized protein n=1 Tax=Antarcticirhabdus aurantiaca TaxID=2606717 RepID=A0ACD4NQV4_9HYPH|nr:hypothetical protein [Antarcticirhabdus aurantiaca]WAJ29244.1 hypothetical protein OXU80_03120 [Jeongeuplla avenae]
MSLPVAGERPLASLKQVAAARAGAPALLGLLALVAALPLAAVEIPPFFDYLNHLSRAHVIAELDTSPTFRDWFEPATFLIPNVGADLALLALQTFTDTLTAGRLLLLAIAWGTLGGAVALGRAASGRMSPWPAFVALVLFNEMLHWGFLNYALGLALLLWGLAAWLVLAPRSRRAQIAAGCVFALLIFFSHLVAFGLFVIAVAAIELEAVLAERRRRGGALLPLLRARFSAALIAAAPLALFAIGSPSNGLPPAPAFNVSPFEKLAPFTRLLSSGNPVLDAAVLLGTAAFLAVLLAFRRIRLDRRLGFAATALFLAQMAMPYSAMHSFFVDNRVATATVLVLLSGLATRKGAPSNTERLGWSALALLLALRSAALVQGWSAAEAELREARAAFEALPRGSLLIGATPTPFEYGTGWFATRSRNPPHEHTASLATIEREAVVPAIFAKPRQNPLVFEPPTAMIKRMSLGPIPRLRSGRDFAALSQRLRAARAEMDAAGYAAQPILVFASDLACADWPPGYGFRPLACGSFFSIAAFRPNGSFVPIPRSEG